MSNWTFNRDAIRVFRFGRCEFARLPLSEDGRDVSQILAMEDYDFPRLEAVPGVGER